MEKVQTQRSIIAILTHGTKINEVVEEMIEKYSLLIWLANVKTTNRSLKLELEDFFYKLRVKSDENCARIKNLSVSGSVNSDEKVVPRNNYNNNSNLVLRSALFDYVATKQGWIGNNDNTNDCVGSSLVEVTNGLFDPSVEVEEAFMENGE